MQGFGNRLSRWAVAGGLMVCVGLLTLRADAQEEQERAEVKIFSLVHADAEELAALINDFSEHFGVSVSSYAPTNAVLAVGSAEDLAKVEAILLRLDKETTGRSPRAAATAPNGAFFASVLEEGAWVVVFRSQNEQLYRLRILNADEFDEEGEVKRLQETSSAYLVAAIGVDYVHLQNRRRDLYLPNSGVREIYRNAHSPATGQPEETK